MPFPYMCGVAIWDRVVLICVAPAKGCMACTMSQEDEKKAFDAQKAYTLHKGRTLYHITRPVQLAPDELPEDFEELGQRDVLVIAKHKTKELYRVTVLRKDGTPGATNFYATWGEPSKSKRAKQWQKDREAEYLKGLRDFERRIAGAAAAARRTGDDVEAAINAADAQFQRENPLFCAEF